MHFIMSKNCSLISTTESKSQLINSKLVMLLLNHLNFFEISNVNNHTVINECAYALVVSTSSGGMGDHEFALVMALKPDD